MTTALFLVNCQVITVTAHLEQERWGDFLEKVASGDSTAVALAAEFVEISDGGNLEDLYKALATSAHVSLCRLLTVIKENNFSEMRCATLFNFLPDELVDDLDAQSRELQWRLDLLEKNQKQLETTGCSKVPSELRKSLKELEEIRKRLKDKGE